MDSAPGRQKPLRLGAVLLGIIFFIWLPFEDQGLSLIFLYALAVSTLLGFYVYQRWQAGPARLWKAALCGCLAGALVTPLILLILAIKAGVHGHAVPESAASELTGILWLTPLWMLAGGLVGAGLGVLGQK